MIDVPIRYFLAPILIWQGLKLRRTALILPEAAGKRHGTTGEGPELSLLIIGDSSAAGVGVAKQEDALSGQCVRSIAPSRKVTWQLIAKTGATTKSTLAALKEYKPMKADVALVALGVNDVTRGVSVRRFLQQQTELRTVLRKRFGVRRMIITAVPPMAEFTALSPLLKWILGAQARRLDLALSAAVKKEADCTYLKIQFPSDPALMASDGFHPSAKTYTIWGEAAARVVLATSPAPSAAPCE